VLLKRSLKTNISLVILVWILGCSLFGSFFMYIVIIYKGFSIGYTVSSIIATLGIKHGTVFIISSLVLQNLVFLPAIFMLSSRAIQLYHNLHPNKYVNIKREFIKYIMVLPIILAISILASFIEVYGSTSFLLFLKNFL